MSRVYAHSIKYMARDAQATYMKLRDKEEPEDLNTDEVRLLLKKARQGHIYGRTRHPSLEAKDDGQRTSTSSEWSDTSGTRPEREAIQRDDSVAEGEPSTANGTPRTSVRAPKRGAK